jgi:hypothetical protein
MVADIFRFGNGGVKSEEDGREVSRRGLPSVV